MAHVRVRTGRIVRRHVLDLPERRKRHARHARRYPAPPNDSICQPSGANKATAAFRQRSVLLREAERSLGLAAMPAGRKTLFQKRLQELRGAWRARAICGGDKYHFQKLEQIDGFVTTKRTADGGVDGRLYFAMPENDARQRRPLESMAIEVKGGKNVGINVERELRGVLDNDQALMAVG